MQYEFHTTLPIQKRDSNKIEYPWVEAILSWDQDHSSPRVTEFYCDDPAIMEFWNSAGASSLEMALLSDAIRLHTAENFGDDPNHNWSSS